jgi:hypothetical protein
MKRPQSLEPRGHRLRYSPASKQVLSLRDIKEGKQGESKEDIRTFPRSLEAIQREKRNDKGVQDVRFKAKRSGVTSRFRQTC